MPPEQLVEQVLAPADERADSQQVYQSVRIKAVRRLARQGKQAVPQFRRVVAESRDPVIRGYAMDGLGKARDTQSIPQLIAAMEGDDRALRARAAAAIDKLWELTSEAD